jgi:hypothetical protein
MTLRGYHRVMRFVVFAALLLLGACQPLPHPFADDRPPVNSDILTPPDSAGIIVEPVAGAPEPTAHDLATAMANAFQKEDILASTEARNRNSFRLASSASTADNGDGNLRVTVNWQLHEPGGTVFGQQESTAVMPAAAWKAGGLGVAVLAQPPAPVFAKLIQTRAPTAVGGLDPLIAVRTVTGAPGDGGHALTSAMSDALRHANLLLAETPQATPNFIVEGKVEMSAPDGGRQKIKISWVLRRANGEQIGQVNQENAVAAGSLNGPWGLTAFDVANSAAPGITALIDEARRAAARS